MSQKTPTLAELLAANQALMAKVQELEARKAGGRRITAKVSEKGAVSVYGLGRFPTTLYMDQWIALYGEDVKAVVMACIEENKDLLDAIAADHRAAKPAAAAAPATTATTKPTGKLTFTEWKARQVAEALAARGSR